MKKILLTFAIAVSVASVQAQGILSYGNVGYSSRNTEDESRTTVGTGTVFSNTNTKTQALNINPGLGFVINRHIAIGANLNLNYSKFESAPNLIGQEATVKTRDLGIGPFFRYTTNFGKIFFVYHQLNVSYLGGRSETELFSSTSGASLSKTEDTYDGIGASLFPAAGFNVKPGFALTFNIGGIGYNRQVWDLYTPNPNDMSKRTINDFSATFGREINIGVQMLFDETVYREYQKMHMQHRMRGHRAPMDETRRMNGYEEDDREDAPRKKRKSKNEDED